MLIHVRRSKDLFLQFQSFECSSLFASNSCIYCGTTRCNKCGRIRTKWLLFFTFIEGCCVVIEKKIDKKLPNRISYQIWCKRCLTGKFGIGSKLRRGIKSANGPTPEQLFSPIVMAFPACTCVGPDPGPNPPTDMDWGGPNPLWHRHSRKEIRAEIPAATSIFTFMNQVNILKDKILDKM